MKGLMFASFKRTKTVAWKINDPRFKVESIGTFTRWHNLMERFNKRERKIKSLLLTSTRERRTARLIPELGEIHAAKKKLESIKDETAVESMGKDNLRMGLAYGGLLVGMLAAFIYNVNSRVVNDAQKIAAVLSPIVSCLGSMPILMVIVKEIYSNYEKTAEKMGWPIPKFMKSVSKDLKHPVHFIMEP